MQIAFVCIIHIDCDAIALLVRRVDDVLIWVETDMSRPFFFSVVCASRGKRCKGSFVLIKSELEYGIGAG